MRACRRIFCKRIWTRSPAGRISSAAASAARPGNRMGRPSPARWIRPDSAAARRPSRNGGEARYVDTLAYALYRREVYGRVGLYDERLHAEPRITTCITACARPAIRFFFSPDIVSWHAARKTLRGQLSQKWGQRLLDRPDDADSAALLCPAPSRSCAVCAGADRAGAALPASPRFR